MSTYQLSKFSATFVTFLLSALCHELVMAVVSKKIRLYLFMMQVSSRTDGAAVSRLTVLTADGTTSHDRHRPNTCRSTEQSGRQHRLLARPHDGFPTIVRAAVQLRNHQLTCPSPEQSHRLSQVLIRVT